MRICSVTMEELTREPVDYRRSNRLKQGIDDGVLQDWRVSCCGEAARERLENEAPGCASKMGLVGCLLRFRLIGAFAKA